MRSIWAAILGVVFLAGVPGMTAPSALAAERGTAPGWTQDPICTIPPVAPDVAGIVYSSPDGSNPLTIDVYQAAGTDPHPSLLLIHGGSWKTGCKGSVSSLADRFRQAGFTVFDPAYRTDCSPFRPPQTLDDPTYCKGIGIPYEIDDVRAAVLWMRTNAGLYGGDPARIATMGPSSGGHLAYLQAVLDAGTTGAPDAVAGWSGEVELRIFADGSSVCAVAKCSAERRYLGCMDTECPSTWDDHSAYSFATAAAPPAMIVNSTTETATAYQSAVDFHNVLDSLGVVNGLCSVTGNHHGQGLANFPCTENGLTGFNATVAFLLANL